MDKISWIDKWLTRDYERVNTIIIDGALKKVAEEMKYKAIKYGRITFKDTIKYEDGTLQIGVYEFQNRITGLGNEIIVEKRDGKMFGWSLQIQKDRVDGRVNLILVEDIGKEEDIIIGKYECISEEKIFDAMGELFKINRI